jgi:site-specific DNA-methyltransferase (adenine-specific)
LVSSQRPFGLPTNFIGEKRSTKGDVVVIGRNQARSYTKRANICKNNDLIDSWKVFISRAYGERVATDLFVLGKPFVGAPGEVCTETYVAIGPFKNEAEAKNVMSYIITKFFRFLVLMKKPTQDTLRQVYSFVPMQDFSKPWTDEELYRKYKLEPDEIAFIESMIKPME